MTVAAILLDIKYGEIRIAQLIVRDLEVGVKTCLRRRATRHGRSLEAEVRDILRNAAKEGVDRMSFFDLNPTWAQSCASDSLWKPLHAPGHEG